jgi:transposase-like protein
MRRRGRRREKVTLKEKIEIVHRVAIQQYTVKEVAVEFRVLLNYVY